MSMFNRLSSQYILRPLVMPRSIQPLFKPLPLLIAMCTSVHAAVSVSSIAQPALPQTLQPQTLPTIQVSAHPLNRRADDLINPSNIIAPPRLFQQNSSTLAEALDSQLGVRAETFGAGAARPVIRGQTAPRVKVLSDSAAVLDASEISPDHNIPIEPMLAERVEILRGPATLLYGGGAIGGVVNVLDRKIPTAMPEQAVEGQAGLRFNTAAAERAAVFGVTAALSDHIALRVEGVSRQTTEYRAPKRFFVAEHAEHESHESHDEHEDEHHDDEHHDEQHDEHGSQALKRIAGTATAGDQVSVGLSWIDERGYLGVAYSKNSNDYGLSGHSHAYHDCHLHGLSLHCGSHDEHEHEEESEDAPVIRLRSERVDLRGELRDPFAGIEKIRVRAGLTDYQHQEIEAGQVATTFSNRGYDSRVELEHQPIAGWRGVVGLQHQQAEFSAKGEEAYLPTTDTRNSSVFLLEHYQWQDWHFELGARQEWQQITPDTAQPASDLRGTSLSASALWDVAPTYSLVGSLSRSQRLPHAQELYANGVHLATNTLELGDANLGAETSLNAELGLRRTDADLTVNAQIFYNRVDDYIYANTLDRFEDFRLIQYTQAEAEFVGAELELGYALTPSLSATVFADHVEGRLRGGEDLPRIPATRWGSRVSHNWQDWQAEAEWYQVNAQRQIAAFERITPAYQMLNLTVSYHAETANQEAYQVFLRGANLLDEVAYNHTSFLSNVVPMMGRNLSLGVQVSF
ncbi:MAG: TonB-dependent receptor [Moraxellaceae bacterium]